MLQHKKEALKITRALSSNILSLGMAELCSGTVDLDKFTVWGSQENMSVK